MKTLVVEIKDSYQVSNNQPHQVMHQVQVEDICHLQVLMPHIHQEPINSCKLLSMLKIQYGTMQYSAVQYSIVQYSTVQYSTL